MTRFLLRRGAFLIATMLVVSLLVFVLNEATPGDVARKVLGPYASAEQVALLTEELGLDRPVLVRYGDWLADLSSGALGTSTLYKAPVAEVLWDRLANTALLAALAFALIVPLSLILGVAAGVREASPLDRSLSLAAVLATSIPEFASGALFVSVFAIGLGWLPGTAPLSPEGVWSPAAQLVLPVAVIVLYDVGYVMRMVRASMVAVRGEEYVKVARAKGLTEFLVVRRHMLKNALIPVVTLIGITAGYLLGGSIVVEQVFAIPGVGRMGLQAIVQRDYPVLQAVILLVTFIFVLVNLLVDLVYVFLDPRIRYA